jgi:cholesterol oxidase
MAENRPQISKSHSQLRRKYDVLIVGSGYGGAITAARLGQINNEYQLGLSIALIERGMEWQPGDFPEDQHDLKPATRRVRGKVVDNPLGLFELRGGGDSDLLFPCGLGGSSLIDSGVLTMPDLRIFEQEGWPDEIREDMEYGRFDKYFKRASAVLGKNPRPFSVQLDRYNQVAQAAGLLNPIDTQTGCHQSNLDYAINFEKQGPDEKGLVQIPCTHCGCCMTGCNVGAKLTLLDSYLHMAQKEGVNIFAQTEMRYFTRDQGCYLAHLIKYSEDVEKVDWDRAPKLDQVLAKVLVLAAGSVGSCEILLRSKSENRKHKALTSSLSRLGLDQSAVPAKKITPLRFPSLVGKQMGRNGNWMFVVYNAKTRVDSVGLGLDQGLLDWSVGPTITGALDSSAALAPLRESITFYDVAFPRATAIDLKAVFKKASNAASDNKSYSDRFTGFRRRIFEKDEITRDDTLNYSLGFLTCGHDDQEGSLRFNEDGLLCFYWQRFFEQEVYKVSRAKAEILATNLGGGLITELDWNYELGQKPLTLHLLGGCNMGNNRIRGVVNHFGAVYDPNDESNSKALVKGLFVAGRATIPTSLGTAPAMVVAGLAERSAEKIALQLMDGSLGLGPKASEYREPQNPMQRLRPKLPWDN